MSFIKFYHCRIHRKRRWFLSKPRALARFVFLVPLIMLSACAQREMVKVPPPAPDVALFSSAERFFEQKLYNDALSAYQSYLTQYPRKPMADAALMKIGMIYYAQGNFQKERQSLERFIMDYPHSPFLPDVRRAFFFALSREGNYSAAVEQGNILLRDPTLSRIHLVRLLKPMPAPMNALKSLSNPPFGSDSRRLFQGWGLWISRAIWHHHRLPMGRLGGRFFIR
jgi:tetratricopeptide (TPR) repeat protein